MTESELSLGAAASILSSGYAALDVIVDGEAMGHRAGGTAVNVAANLAYLGWGSEVTAILGDDPAGRRLRGDLTRAGVGTEFLTTEPDATTPVVVHEVLPQTHRFRFGCPACGRRFPRYRSISTEHAKWVSDLVHPDVFFFDRVSAGTLFLADAVRERGGLVVFEPATRGRAHHFAQALQLAHIVKLSDERLEALGDRYDGRTRSGQVHILTNGGSGATWRLGHKAWTTVPGFSMDIVDAGGAGDWTTAGLLASMPSLEPEGLVDVNFDHALRVSQAIAALSCRSRGARGISQALTRSQLLSEATRLLCDGTPARPPSQRLRPSRRAAACSACLAGG